MPRYNRYNTNRMSLNTADFQPAVFTPIEFTPVEQDYSILERAMAKQEERKQKAIAQQSNIEAAIAQVELDASEDEWKQNYINDINRQIDEASEVGDYASALNIATSLAGKTAKDPALFGRERYNKERQEFLKSLEAKKNAKLISNDSYERAIAENTYNYEDIRNTNGEIVGGSKWEATFNPRNDVSLTDALNWMEKYIGVSSETTGGGGGTTQTFRTSDGKTTTNPNDPNIVSIQSVNKGGSRTESTKEVTPEQWEEAYKAYIAANPELEADFNQLWDNYIWKYKELQKELTNPDLTEEQRNSIDARIQTRKNSLTDSQLGFLTKDEWLLKQIQPSFNVMSYRQHSLVNEAGSTLVDENTLRNRTVASVLFNNNTAAAEIYASGAPIEMYYDYLNETIKAKIPLEENSTALINDMLKTELSKDNPYNIPIPFVKQN